MAGALAVLAATAVAVVTLRGPSIKRPEDPCTSPPPLLTRHGVTLQPLAMQAFRRAETLAGTRIPVVQSYRSCSDQALACVGICGAAGGCPGTCASPGLSWHQLGAAIDLSRATLKRTRIVGALQEAGWCQSLPESDPGHFSYGGCH